VTSKVGELPTCRQKGVNARRYLERWLLMPAAQVRDIASVTGNEAGQLSNTHMTARHLTAKLITELAHAAPVQSWPAC
jgi:hypothetical protein